MGHCSVKELLKHLFQKSKWKILVVKKHVGWLFIKLKDALVIRITHTHTRFVIWEETRGNGEVVLASFYPLVSHYMIPEVLCKTGSANRL